MKYTSPIYSKETMETVDVICASVYASGKFNKEITEDATTNQRTTSVVIDARDL